MGNIAKSISNFLNNLVISFFNFLKSSYLSILFLVIILLLVQALDQANTLLVDMIEIDNISLILCFIIISFFASVLAHYPRYIYYAEDINGSRDDHFWYMYKWLCYPFFVFSKIDADNYEQDYKVKFLRQSLGLVIFVIWHYYIYETFYPKLIFSDLDIQSIRNVTVLLCVIPAIILIILLYYFDKYQDPVIKKSSKEEIEQAKKHKKKFYTRGVNALLIVMLTTYIMGIVVVSCVNFSLLGYWLLQSFTFLLAVLYVCFRAFRVYVIAVYYKLKFISDSISYLRYFFIFFIVLILMLLYSNIAVFKGWDLLNAMAILLSCFFIIYYTIACLVKYFFMLRVFKTQKEELDSKSITDKQYMSKSKRLTKKELRLLSLGKQEAFSVKRRRIASVIIFILIVFCVISYNSESVIHQLEAYKSIKVEETLDMDTFKDKLKEKIEKPLIFVAAHGGGLKANIWTMKVLNEIQKKTSGKFLDQTISFSGASGGMMGLSLYAVLDGRYTNQFDTIDIKIDKVAEENFASKDVAMMFGADFFRKFYPFKNVGAYRDRSYYSMVTYRNILEDSSSRVLDSVSFKSYWKKNIFNNNRGYSPSLIINTAKTDGKRGVFYSVEYPKQVIFQNSDILSQLYDDSDIAYYEAISSTNRFPALSPAAKIAKYGHYIDAGAIDNSGLLSSLDLYNYLEKDSVISKTPKVFVEIINGRGNYIRYLMQKFKEKHNINNIEIDEIEQDNIVADIKTGLDLNKIPNYLSDFISNWSEEDSKITYIPIYLPFQIQLEEVKKFLGGDEFENDKQIEKLQEFLDEENTLLDTVIDDKGTIWETYEPTLARHLSPSTVKYYNRVINKDTNILKNIQHIDSILGN